MKFRDDRIVRIDKYKFEHARIVQGSAEWGFFVLLAIVGLFLGEPKLGLLILGIIIFAFTGSCTYYSVKLGSLKTGVKVGILKLLSTVSTMIG